MYLPKKQTNLSLDDILSDTDAENEILIKTDKKPHKKKLRLKKSISSFFRTTFIMIVVLMVTFRIIIRPVQVEGSSMAPTLTNGQLGITDAISPKIGNIQRFDIVIIKMSSKYLIKRVIGLPGETISYKNDKLYINGKEISEEYLDSNYKAAYAQFTADIDEITLGDDEYYCLGDNRPNSMDSRTYGPFKATQIVSKELIFF